MTSALPAHAAAARGGDEPTLSAAAAPVRSFGAWLLVVTAAAALLRLWRLDDWSFWVDEAHTYRDATLPLAGDQGFLSGYRCYYPLSYLLLRGLLALGLPDGHEGWLRLPFALLGIATVPLLGALARPLVGARAALVAAALLAVNPWHLYWSQNARGYVAVVFCATLAGGLFAGSLGGGRPGRRLLACVVAALGGLFHPSGWVMLLAFLLQPLAAQLAAAGGARRLVALGAAAAAVALLPALAQALPPFTGFLRAKPDASLLHLLQTAAFYFRLPLLLAAALGVLCLGALRRAPERLFVVVWALVPLLAVAAVGAGLVKTTARYAIAALPAVVVLAAVAAVHSHAAVRAALGGGRGAALAAALPLFLFADLAAYDYLYYGVQHGDRARWREAAAYVRAAAGDKPLRVVTVNEPTFLYYLRPDHWRRLGDADPHPGTAVAAITPWELGAPADGDPCGFVRRQVAAATAAQAALFVVVTLPELAELDRHGALREVLAREFQLVHLLPCTVGPKDETVYVYRPVGGG